MTKNLYIIAGCNGAGKTTASYTLLPEILDCKEFVNADEIAKGLSPFRPEKVSIEAGRLMLQRIDELLNSNEDFAFETTLATKSYKGKIQNAKNLGYKITTVFFWLRTIDLAKERVKLRVSEGGHNIPEEIIERRYQKGIINFFNIYLSISDEWMVIDNSQPNFELIAEGQNSDIHIVNSEKWNELKQISYGSKS